VSAGAAGALESLLRRDRLVVAASLLGIVAIAWIYLVQMATDMPGMSVALIKLAATPLGPWSTAYWVMMLTMWAVMMVGMMLPSATPAILLFSRVVHHSAQPVWPLLRTWLFAAGYLLVWGVFSVAATGLQWGLEMLAWRSPAIVAAAPDLAGTLLVLAGAYQWTPLKDVCLRHCRGPVEFLTRHWRPGLPGALRMGAAHGLFCLGCCWLLMLLLFVGGVMNLLLVGTITLFVLLEKLLPYGDRAGRISGLALIILGLLLVLVV
jgi:predicted metal-binding membrane protein